MSQAGAGAHPISFPVLFAKGVKLTTPNSAEGEKTWIYTSTPPCLHAEVEVTLPLTVGQSVCLGIEHPRGTCDQVLLPLRMLLSEICCLVSVGRPL
jgi:hypothetical protein